MDTEDQDVKLMSLKEPRFLSVVKKPANRISFRVVRSEDGEEKKEFAALEARREHKTKIKRNSKLISISFPNTTTEDDLEYMRSHYGLTDEDYTMEDVDGSLVFARNGEAPEATAKVSMPDGATAEVEVPITVRSADKGDRYLSVIALRFDKNDYPVQDLVEGALRGYEIDFNSDSISEDATHFILTRQEVEEAEMVEVSLKEGFAAVVIRSTTDDVPASISLGVNSSAYGSYGWGQLNFASAMADIEYTQILDNSLYVLNNVLENILFWSDLSLGDRKVLVNASLASYGEFVSNLMDALPVQPETQRSENVQSENNMTTQAQATPGSESLETEQVNDASTEVEAKREEATPEVTAEVTEEAAPEATNEFITRTEFKDSMDSMQANIIAALTPTAVAPAEVTEEVAEVRSEDVAEQTESKADPVLELLTKIGASVDTLATRMDKVEETSNATVSVRTEDDDAEKIERSEKQDAFFGIFGRQA